MMAMAQALTISQLQQQMAIEAMACCIAMAVGEVEEANRSAKTFTTLMLDNENECRGLLLKLQAMLVQER